MEEMVVLVEEGELTVVVAKVEVNLADLVMEDCHTLVLFPRYDLNTVSHNVYYCTHKWVVIVDTNNKHHNNWNLVVDENKTDLNYYN